MTGADAVSWATGASILAGAWATLHRASRRPTRADTLARRRALREAERRETRALVRLARAEDAARTASAQRIRLVYANGTTAFAGTGPIPAARHAPQPAPSTADRLAP